VITPADAALHVPTSDDPTWAETNFWGFYVPELKLNCGVYALFRPNLGVALSTVCMNSRRTYAHWEADYCDLQMHLPMGKDFDLMDYRLANGLSVRAVEPNMAYEVDFDDGDGTEIHFAYRSLMPAFDIHDPDQDPMKAAQLETQRQAAASSGTPRTPGGGDGHAGSFAWGTAYNGHFDQTGVFEGEVVLGGSTTPFRCVSTWDHSWGPRSERHAHTMSWLHAHFSDDFAFHAIFDFDTSDGGRELRLTHGYVLENGEVFGLRAGRGETVRKGYYPEEKIIEVTDRTGRTFSFRGEALTSFPWQAWPNVVGFNALLHWEDGEGRTGLGETQDFLGLQTLTALS
jgi:hypothetical protein